MTPINDIKQMNMNRKQRIYDALMAKLNPKSLAVEDESSGHNVPKGSETHFKVLAVCDQFENKNRVARHRLINALLATEFETGLHALSLHLFTPDEWQNKQKEIPASPACRNGKRHG